jgi:cytidine deaminase
MSKEISSENLIKIAVEVLNPKMVGSSRVGQVASALLTSEGTIFRGVCIDTKCGLGFCAERTAISQMITNKEYKIKKIVAVWNDNPERKLKILPPCGVCRQYMSLVSEDSDDIDVILGAAHTVKLRELLPYNEWEQTK